MGIFSSGAKKRKSERVLILNIGSSSVSAAFTAIEDSVSTINATITNDIAILADVDIAQFELEMRKSLDKTLAEISKFRLEAPNRIVVYFAAPWYASQVRVAKLSRSTQFVVTKALVNDMIAKELKFFEEEEIAGGRGGAEALRAIESKTLQVKLNGYSTSDPIGITAQELELSIFISVAPERTIKEIEEIIVHYYKKPITFSSFLSASFLTARDFFPHQEDYLLVDIGGEVTDITLVRESTMVSSLSFPKGRNFILRKLADGLKRSIPEAVTMCTLYTEGKVEETVKDSCTAILNEAKDQWLESFQKALFSISNELSIPDTILLFVGPDMAPWFVETIRREKFTQYSLTEKEFKVIVLDAEVFHESLAFGEGVPRNPFVMIETLACARHVPSERATA